MNRVKTAIAMVAVVAVLIGSLAVISVQDTEAERSQETLQPATEAPVATVDRPEA